ncbi:hypothetical protein ACQEUX_03380 [Micromonospora sp. CA-259024]|uniref:hypothetical protein n=1 Tax=Micromonospora sp. CA-259024 TaxID=3239965 RepID=UPI003D8FAC41
MRTTLTRTLRRTVTVAGTTLAAVLAIALPASAHTSIVLDETDVVPWLAPLSVDGNDPLSYYGTLPQAGAIRSYQFDSPGTMPLSFALLLPDQAPENTLPATQLPRILIVAPDGHVTVVSPTIREVVPIPEIGQQYLRVSKYDGPSIAGRYSVIVTGLAGARFNISTGHHGVSFHGIERGSVATTQQIIDWYSTAP